MESHIDTLKKTDLKRLTPDDLLAFCLKQDLRRYRADQIFQWIYQKGVTSFEEMTNLSLDLRSRLDAVARISTITQARRQKASDGTIKFLFRLEDDRYVESVLIPEFDSTDIPVRLTVCVSSQVGCIFGCSFCATGKMGFFRNLSVGEITDQISYINQLASEQWDRKITNIVYMGMGEPLNNYKNVLASADIITHNLGFGMSSRRITLSTVGLTKQIRQLGKEKRPFNLAISLHAADDDKRNRIMPINQSLNLKALREALLYYYEQTNQPVTYEYLLFDEFNDSPEDAGHLAAIAGWIPSKVNIIMYNKVAGVSLKRAREDRLNEFMRMLTRKDVRATVRRSRGDDIDAGCGQLAISEDDKRGKSMGF